MIKSAESVTVSNPFIGFVPFKVSIYIPIDDVNISLSPTVNDTVSGVTGIPFTVIVASETPFGAFIFIPPASFVVSAPGIPCSLSLFSAFPFVPSIIVPVL